MISRSLPHLTKSPFPNKVTFTGSGIWTYLFGGTHYSWGTDLDKRETKRYNKQMQCSNLDWILDAKKCCSYMLWSALLLFSGVKTGMGCVRESSVLRRCLQEVQGRGGKLSDPFLVGQSIVFPFMWCKAVALATG